MIWNDRMHSDFMSFLTELFAIEAVDVEAKDAWTFFKLMDVSGDAATYTFWKEYFRLPLLHYAHGPCWYPFSMLLPPILHYGAFAPFLFVSKLQWGDGELDADRFVEGCMRLQGTARSMDVSLVLQEQRRLRKKILSILAAISAKSP